MRKIREVLRLRFEAQLLARQVAQSVRSARSSVAEYERRFAVSGLNWPLPAGLSDTEIERRLFPPASAVPADSRPLPDWSMVHQELRRPGVTLMLLWEEYRAAYPALTDRGPARKIAARLRTMGAKRVVAQPCRATKVSPKIS